MAAEEQPAGDPRRRFLSLRWQAFAALSLTLVVSNALIGFVAFQDARGQYDLQQSMRRGDNARLLRSLLTRTDNQLAGITNLLPQLGGRGDGDAAEPLDSLREALARQGALLAFEWDVLAIHWIDLAGVLRLSWPGGALSDDLVATLKPAVDAPFDLRQELACEDRCQLYLAAPMLWHGEHAGTLVLVHSVADALLTFHELTDSEVAIAVPDSDPERPGYSFPALTHRDRTGALLERLETAVPALPAAESPSIPAQALDGRWYEVYRVGGFSERLSVLVIDDVSAARAVMMRSTRNSVLLGAGSLLFSGLVLVGLAHYPLRRLKGIARALPMIAEGRYRNLRDQLLTGRKAAPVMDELELLRDTTIRITDQMEAIEQDKEKAKWLASWLGEHDPLTQLQNRTGFLRELQAALEHSARYRRSAAILLLDLDHFREINDVYGNRAGDEVLVALARKLTDLLRPSDTLARVGGDEFAVLLPEGDDSSARECALRIQQALASTAIEIGGQALKLSANIGITTINGPSDRADEMILRADLAVNRARALGPGRIQLASEVTGADSFSARAEWRTRIDRGLEDGLFLLYYQPIVRIESGTLAHCESLLRMRGDDGEVLSPYQFIPLAEETGQITDIDHWVVRAAIEQLVAMPALQLSVNLSASALADTAFLREIPGLLQHAGVSPQRLILEVTETAAVQSLSGAGDIMAELAEHGCHFALDDFGSGYASYSHLRHLPVREVKIDGAFIRNLDTDEDNRVFVKSITELLQGLGKSVVAEFVENEEILRILAQLGVDMAQGYLLGRPEPAPNFGPWRPVVR